MGTAAVQIGQIEALGEVGDEVGDSIAHALDPDIPERTLCGRIREFGFMCCDWDGRRVCAFCGRRVCPTCLKMGRAAGLC